MTSLIRGDLMSNPEIMRRAGDEALKAMGASMIIGLPFDAASGLLMVGAMTMGSSGNGLVLTSSVLGLASSIAKLTIFFVVLEHGTRNI